MLFNHILNARFSALLTRAFAIKGPGSPVPTLAPEISPSYDVNSRDDAALAFLRMEKLCGIGQQVGPVAAEYAGACLLNPAGSGLLLEVEQLIVFSTGTVFAYLGVGTSGLATPVNPFVRDTRWGPVSGGTYSAAAKVSQETNAVLPGGNAIARFPPNALGFFAMPIVISPGHRLILANGTVNLAIAYTMQWRERALPPEETVNG